MIINEKINVAFSRRTARTRNSHKNKNHENIMSNSTEEKNSHENDCSNSDVRAQVTRAAAAAHSTFFSKYSVFSSRLNISMMNDDVNCCLVTL